MESTRKFYRHRFVVDVLSETLLTEMDLNDLRYLISEGPCSGWVRLEKTEVVGAKQMANLLIQQASSPEFFGITEDGEDIEDYSIHNK